MGWWVLKEKIFPVLREFILWFPENSAIRKIISWTISVTADINYRVQFLRFPAV